MVGWVMNSRVGHTGVGLAIQSELGHACVGVGHKGVG